MIFHACYMPRPSYHPWSHYPAEICALLGYKAASSGNPLPRGLPLQRITTRRRVLPQKSADLSSIAAEASNRGWLPRCSAAETATQRLFFKPSKILSSLLGASIRITILFSNTHQLCWPLHAMHKSSYCIRQQLYYVLTFIFYMTDGKEKHTESAFRRVHKIAKTDHWLRHVCLSVWLPARMEHGSHWMDFH
jgi:hypothetical protein